MSDLVRDYLALPDVRFLVEHWRAVLVLWGAALAVLFWASRRRP